MTVPREFCYEVHEKERKNHLHNPTRLSRIEQRHGKEGQCPERLIRSATVNAFDHT